MNLKAPLNNVPPLIKLLRKSPFVFLMTATRQFGKLEKKLFQRHFQHTN